MTATLSRAAVEPEQALADVKQTAHIYNCSQRHTYRLSDAGTIPPPVKLGALVRWRLRTGNPMTGILDHIEAGCPSCRKGAGR